MANIDIPLPDDLKKLLAAPICVKLPKPSPTKVTLPTGGTLKALTDISKGIPTDCSMTFSLLLQMGPLLASMECLLKILKLLKPMIDLVTNPPPTPKLIADVVEAAKDLVPCFLIPTPANLVPFVKDLLCLILKMLRCIIGQMKTLAGLMGGLTLSLNAATAEGNEDLINSIKCSQDNAALSADHLAQSIEPLAVLLSLVEPIMKMAGVPPVKLDSIGAVGDAEALNQVVTTLEGVADIIESIANALPGGECS